MLEGLTPRERQVLSLVAKGQASKEIADALGMHEDTVKHDVSETLGSSMCPAGTAAAIWYVGHANWK